MDSAKPSLDEENADGTMRGLKITRAATKRGGGTGWPSEEEGGDESMTPNIESGERGKNPSGGWGGVSVALNATIKQREGTINEGFDV